MTVIIKNLLKDELNRCIVISGDNDYIKAKDALEERNGNSSWYLVVVLDGGKYLVTKFENLDVQVLGSGAEILDRPLKLLGKPLVSAPVFKQSTSIKKISNAINKNSAPVAVIAYKGAVAGIISEDSLKETLGMNSFEQGGDKWIKEKLLWLKENPWRALRYIFSLIPIIIGYIAFWQSIKPERLVMTGEWNIAVARFIELGEPNINDEVRLISDVFANRLESEMSEFQEQIDVVVQVMKRNN